MARGLETWKKNCRVLQNTDFDRDDQRPFSPSDFQCRTGGSWYSWLRLEWMNDRLIHAQVQDGWFRWFQLQWRLCACLNEKWKHHYEKSYRENDVFSFCQSCWACRGLLDTALAMTPTPYEKEMPMTLSVKLVYQLKGNLSFEEKLTGWVHWCSLTGLSSN